jgi:hypothetical protein
MELVRHLSMQPRYHLDGSHPLNGEIFVFGSNLAGIHGAGAAKIAYEKYGAQRGIGSGFVSDKCYGIPTKDHRIVTLSLAVVQQFVDRFVDTTKIYPEQRWFVTRVGCGLAGYTDEQIAPMFKGAINCSFAEEWRKYIG